MSNRKIYLELKLLKSTLHSEVITTTVRMYCRSNHSILSQIIKGKTPRAKLHFIQNHIHNLKGFLSKSNSIESVDSVSDPKLDLDWIRIHLIKRIQIQTAQIVPPKKEKIKKKFLFEEPV